MPKIALHAALSLFFIAAGVGALSAGEISQELAEHIAGRNSGEFIRVLIIPVSDHDPSLLKQTLTNNFRSRAERHRFGMEQLQETARRSQADILGTLNQLEKTGKAKNARGFWVANIIEAELPAGELAALAENPRIERIELYPTVVAIPDIPADMSSPSTQAQAVGKNLEAVKADSAWAAGYDGRGRIVCSFDTGVDGLHPALVGNYRGNKGYAASQCWFSSVDSSDYPHYFQTVPYNTKITTHGTHTTGIMVGHDDITGDTIGVAPGADWIAAVAIDVPGTSIFEAFQWAADPDGDPNTATDIPDVINHSWGILGIGCSDIFWDVIDNVEAMGIVNIFAAGNEGLSEYSTRSPANRALDSLTNFAVGAVDTTFTLPWSLSSRGPSVCDSVSIKPNVTAPGMKIRSSIPPGTYPGFPDSIYFLFSGTSGAAPHVSGAVAILRQKNPDATVDEIKNALLLSVRDIAAPGPDDSTGWGIIDIMEALRLIDSLAEPSLEIARFEYGEVAPGDLATVTVALKNVGAPVDNVSATFSDPDPGLTILTDQIDFGYMDKDSIVDGNTSLDVQLDASLDTGRFYSLDMIVTGDGDYSLAERIDIFVGSRGERAYFHHDTGLVRFTVSNFGAFGFFGTMGLKGPAGSFTPLGFEGYQLDRDTNDLYQGALVIGVDSFHVSDCAQNIAFEADNDFAVLPMDSLTSGAPAGFADEESIAWFDDSFAEHPIGLTIRQRSYGWHTPPDNTYIILEYVIINTSGNVINGVRAGLFLDWDIRVPKSNRGSFLPGDDLSYVNWTDGSTLADFRGVKVLNPEGLTNHYMYIYDFDISGSKFTEGRKYRGLMDSSQGTVFLATDVAHITATGPFNLDIGESDTAVFAIIGGRTWTEFMETAVRAEQKYADVPTEADDAIAQIPEAFSLRQNYPNPFNPATSITFAIPRSGHVRVEIFDILGRLVATVHDGDLAAGEHTVVWDGTNNTGEAVASGIYLYRVRFGDSDRTRKMILVK